MKSIVKMLAIHKTFEAGTLGTKQITLYVHDGHETKKLNEKETCDLFTNLIPGTIIRLTAVNVLDGVLQAFQAAGGVIQFAHWHNTGIDSGLPPEAIVEAYYKVPADKFRIFTYDADLAELRKFLQTRDAINQFYGDCIRKIKCAGRNSGIVDEEDFDKDSDLIAAVEGADAVFSTFKTPNDKGKDVSFDTRVDQLAVKIPLCVLFNKVAGIKTGFGTAATVATVTGGINRFDNVAKLWKHFGYAPGQKRIKGQSLGYSPKGRTAMFLVVVSIEKMTANPWNAYLKEAKAFYTQKHADGLCKGCKAPKGHARMQAIRKTAKEILKRWFLAANGQQFIEGYVSSENRNGRVPQGVRLLPR